MKKPQIKKPNLSVKKPSAKGVALKSAKENPNRGAVAPHPNPLPKGEGRVRVFNLRTWHKIFAAFASIAIIGIVVFFQFAPENARSKTFTFLQTTWSSVSGTAVHNPDVQDKTTLAIYASNDAQSSALSDTEAIFVAFLVKLRYN